MTNKNAEVVKIRTLTHAHAFVPQCFCDKADIGMERKNFDMQMHFLPLSTIHHQANSDKFEYSKGLL